MNNKRIFFSYKDLLAKIKKSLRGRKDIFLKKCGTLIYKTKEGPQKYDYIRISSREIGPRDKIVLIRAGIHGNETAGPFTLRDHLGEIFDYVHQRGIKLIVYPLDNPSGFEYQLRYNIEEDRGDAGNNDFLRYELEDGRIVDDLGIGDKFKTWFWSSDPKLRLRLPKETSLLHRALKRLPLSQIKAVIDLHQDPFITLAGAYHYAFGDLEPYQKIVEQIGQRVEIFRHEHIDSGYLAPPQYVPEIVQGGKVAEDTFDPVTDANGFIVRHDGTLPDLMYRLGVKHCITVETTTAVPASLADQVNLIWIYGIIDLVCKEN